MKRRIEVDIRRSGQPRPYADSVVVADVTFTMMVAKVSKSSPEPVWEPMYTNVKICEPKVRRFAMAWFDVPAEKGPFSRSITRLEMTKPGVWRVELVEPYTG